LEAVDFVDEGTIGADVSNVRHFRPVEPLKPQTMLRRVELPIEQRDAVAALGEAAGEMKAEVTLERAAVAEHDRRVLLGEPDPVGVEVRVRFGPRHVSKQDGRCPGTLGAKNALADLLEQPVPIEFARPRPLAEQPRTLLTRAGIREIEGAGREHSIYRPSTAQ